MKQKSNKIVTKRIPVTLTEEQIKKIDGLIGKLGSNQSNVLRYMIINWLEEHKK